jgi:hypothetical protein
MSFETPTGELADKHPGDVFYEKLGLPEDFGAHSMEFHGREIQRRDYFFQPDIDPSAARAYEVLSVMDPGDPRFPGYRDAFVAAAQQFSGIE